VHREEGRAHSLPPNPRRIAPRICSDLIFDRHTIAGKKPAKESAEKKPAAKPQRKSA
jgi:hypothetical protein